MSRPALSALVALAAANAVPAQPDPAAPTPLYDKHYAYPNEIPYQVDYNTAARRGPQVGYNICNATTENQNSMCQTSFVNHIDDFCLWAPPTPNSTISDTEGQEVAWCTKHGHGTRLIPDGALTGVQLVRTPNYIQIAGFIDQTQINMARADYGGELDPHGADLRGNPLGALMYSNAFHDNNNTYQQISDWTNFIGNNAFCLKICDPDGRNQGQLCQNIYDRLGCAYNAPNHAKNGTFEPPESDGPITRVPYTPVVPASSNCVTHESTALYTNLPGPTGAGNGKNPPSRSSTASVAAPTRTSDGASAAGISAVATIAGVMLAMAFLA